MNKLNILFMASSKNVGLTFNLTRLAIALKRIGHKVIVLSEPKEQEKGLFEELKSRGVKCYTVCGLDDLSIKTITAARTMGKIIDDNEVAIIHAQGIRHMLVAFLASRIFSRKKKVGIVVSIHSTLHGEPCENVALLIESFLLNTCADLVISVAKVIANRLIAYGLFPQKIVTVHNGIDLELLDEVMCGDECLSLRALISMPSKLFDYLSVGLPVVANDVEGWTDIIKNNRVGIVAQDDPSDFAKGVFGLLDSPNEMFECGSRGTEQIKKHTIGMSPQLCWQKIMTN